MLGLKPDSHQGCASKCHFSSWQPSGRSAGHQPEKWIPMDFNFFIWLWIRCTLLRLHVRAAIELSGSSCFNNVVHSCSFGRLALGILMVFQRGAHPYLEASCWAELSRLWFDWLESGLHSHSSRQHMFLPDTFLFWPTCALVLLHFLQRTDPPVRTSTNICLFAHFKSPFPVELCRKWFLFHHLSIVSVQIPFDAVVCLRGTTLFFRGRYLVTYAIFQCSPSTVIVSQLVFWP